MIAVSNIRLKGFLSICAFEMKLFLSTVWESLLNKHFKRKNKKIKKSY